MNAWDNYQPRGFSDMSRDELLQMIAERDRAVAGYNDLTGPLPRPVPFAAFSNAGAAILELARRGATTPSTTA